MNKYDARETYEMLRASHTLLRMALGACAIIEQPKDKDAAKRFKNKFDACFNLIRKSAESYLALSNAPDEVVSEQVN